MTLVFQSNRILLLMRARTCGLPSTSLSYKLCLSYEPLIKWQAYEEGNKVIHYPEKDDN